MNGLGTQSLKSNQFVPPQEIPLLGFKSILSWGHNILTLGIYASASTLANEHYIRKLEVIQDDLYKQIEVLDGRWDALEKQLTTLLGNVNALKENDWIPTDYKDLADELENEKNDLASDMLQHFEVATSITEIAIGPIVFIGQLVANILTLGLYGVYKNNELKNRISLLKAQNNFIQNHFTKKKDQKAENLEKIVSCIYEEISLKENAKVLRAENKSLKADVNGIKNTDSGLAYFKLKQLLTEIQELKSEEKKLKLQMSALKAEKQKEEEAKTKAQNELYHNSLYTHVLTQKQQKLEQDNKVLQAKLLEKDKAHIVQQTNYAKLEAQFSQLEIKAEKVKQLEHELKKMKDAQAYQPEITKLASQLGPLPPKYTPTEKDGESLGAMDVEEHEDEMSPHFANFSKLYNKRYGAARSAAEIVVASFNYACDQLFMMAENGDMIQLNKSENTPATPGAIAIYCFMAFDLIKGGKIKMDGCSGPELHINTHQKMLPSHSENVMQFKLDPADGKLKPIVQFRYKQRDDFTPSENILNLPNGVNPVAVRWILDQLTEVEMNHLFNHLMKKVIPNDHPENVGTENYFRIEEDSGVIKTQAEIERIQLVSTASELINGIAIALQRKFQGNSLIPSFQDKFDEWDIDAYVRDEDKEVEKKLQVELNELLDEVVQVSQRTIIVDWELDEDVLSDKTYGSPRQPDFLNWIKKTRNLHQALSPYMGQNLLVSSQKPGTEFSKMDLPMLSSQYHYCHEMIGADFGGNGGERCLFSNLIATLSIDKKDITSANVQKMKNAMAAYLSKLIKAKSTWSYHPERHKKDHLSKEALEMKRLAELAEGFEKAIVGIHKCSIEKYQNWLRNNPYDKADINVSNLTSLEIQLAAYTLGVRIALIPINDKYSGCKVDELGRILPEVQSAIFGPNTHEMFYMGLWVDPKNDALATYYGIYPKLNLKNELLFDDYEAYIAAETLNDYWISIKPK